jgi:hypothetical protein
MTKDQTEMQNLREELAELKERVSRIEEDDAGMRKLFASWMSNQVAQAKQTVSRVMAGPGGWPGPADPQQAMIDARARERAALAKDRGSPASVGETYDAATSRINMKRKELLQR